MKNLLGNPINMLTYNIIKGDEKEFEIYKLKDNNFVKFFKFLFSISNEFLLNFLSTIPQNKSLIKEKLKGTNFLQILIALISTKNAFYIARDYKVLFENYLTCFDQKGVTENTKFKIFQSLIKFLYKTNNDSLKKLNLNIIYDILEKYFKDLKVEENIINSLDFIKEKYLKNKEIPLKVIELTQYYLEQKNFSNQQLAIVDFNFEILEKRLIKSISIFDFFSDENLVFIVNFSFIFNNLLVCLDEKSTKDKKIKFRIINNIFELFYSENNINEVNKFSKTLISLFLITKSNYDSNCIFIKFLKESIDISNCICEYMNDNEIKILDSSQLKEDSLILGQIKQLFRDETKFKEIILNLYNIFKHPQERKNYLVSFFQENQVQEDEKYFIKRSILLFIPFSEIENLLELGNSLITQYEDTTKKGNLLKFLSTELNLLYYFTKLLVNTFNNLDIELESNNSLSMSILERILNFLKKLINYRLIDTNIMDFLMLILRDVMIIKDNTIQETINSLILNEILEFIFTNKGFDLKNIVRLYLEYRFKNPELDILPLFFDKYFFNEEKNLYCLKFSNELLKIPKGVNEFKEIIFQEKYKKFVVNDMMKNCQVKIYEIVQSRKNENGGTEESINMLEYFINHEIECLIYEMYNILFENQSGIEKFQKKLFKILYNLSSKENIIDEKINTIEICKLFNIIVKQIRFLPLKASKQIKLMNLALYENIEVRRHILTKISTFFNKINKKSFYFFNYISIITISFVCLGDPEKSIVKLAKDIIIKFFEILRIKHQISELKLKEKSEDISLNSNSSNLAKYIPENYIGLFIMYFVFNVNLHLYYLNKDKKHFEKTIKLFLKIISKNKLEYDNELLINNIISIRKTNLSNRKIFLKVPVETYLKNEINFENFNPDLQKVKNEICDFMIKIIRESFSISEKRHENVQLYCPAIFLSVSNNNQNLFKSNIIENTGEKSKTNFMIDDKDKVKKELFPIVDNGDISNIVFVETQSQKISIANLNEAIKKEDDSYDISSKKQKKTDEMDELRIEEIGKHKEDIINGDNLKRKSRENKKYAKKKSKK